MTPNDVVMLAAAVLGPNGAFVIHETPPMLGVVESIGAGTPPINVVVVWSDGSRVTYAAVNSGATSVLFRLGATANPLPVIGFVAQPKSGAGIPNPGSRLQGPVIQQFGLEDPAGTLLGEVIVVDTPIGFLVISPTDATVLPSA